MFTVYQYHELIGGHCVNHLIALCRLLADVGVIFCGFVIIYMVSKWYCKCST